MVLHSYYGAIEQAFEASMPRSGPSAAGTATIVDLQNAIDRHRLIIQSLLMLLLDKQVITEPDLKRWMDYMDQLDGRVDGKLSLDKSPVTCPQCGRVSPPNSPRCMYCHADLATNVLDRRAQSGAQTTPPPPQK